MYKIFCDILKILSWWLSSCSTLTNAYFILLIIRKRIFMSLKMKTKPCNYVSKSWKCEFCFSKYEKICFCALSIVRLRQKYTRTPEIHEICENNFRKN